MARVKAILKFNSEYPKLVGRGRSFMDIYDFFGNYKTNRDVISQIFPYIGFQYSIKHFIAVT